MQEIWKDIKGYEGYYQISNLGNVKSLERRVVKSNGVIQNRKERIMNKRKSTDGYYMAKLTLNNQSKNIAIHRLVAIHFIPNPNNLPEVNHKDLNRTNNNVENLEWIAHIDNVRYSSNQGRYKGRYGEKNPNYKNKTLKEMYANNPELKKQLARIGEQNGMCVPIRMITNNNTIDFKYIGEAAKYLIDNGYTTSKINSIRTNITKSIKDNKTYLNCYFKRI